MKQVATLATFAGLAVVCSILLSACSGAQPKPAPPNPLSPPTEERQGTVGAASYYADELSGRTTANGERYDPTKFTAAHMHYRFGTRVRVENLDNGKSVIVRINDRGPYKAGRIIDLSAAAARELGMLAKGTVKVLIQVIGE
jgi:rare lipoprotein A